VAIKKHHEINDLVFPPGHPQLKVVYALHPFDGSRYVPFEHFHRRIFEQKVIEALELLAALGSTTIEIRQLSGTEVSKDVAAALPLAGLVGGDVSLSSTSKSGRDSEVLYQATLRPRGRPHVPQGLRWFPHEDFWQSVAKLRLKEGMLDFSLRVQHVDSFGVTAKLGAQFAGLGLELGGGYSDFSATRWEMSGTFAAISPSGDYV
jgi:hypothetical protein